MDIQTQLIITLATMIKMLSYFYPVVILAIVMLIAEKYIKPDLSS
jgi:hypothetical protein